MGKNLLEDLVVEILVRLPIISLIRFRCVCKTWYVLLSDPVFMYKNLIFNHDDDVHKDEYLLFKRHDRITMDAVYSLLSYDTLEASSDTQTLPYNLRLYNNREVRSEMLREVRMDILGSCNGLICLQDDHLIDIVLWNPTTSETKILPQSHVPHPLDASCGYSDIADLFYFDFKTNDYKVIRILEARDDYYIYTNDEEGHPLRYAVDIYSLRSDSWRKADCTYSVGVGVISNQNQMHINGTYHWPALMCDEETILSFDSDLEVFRTTGPPHKRIIGMWMTYFLLHEQVGMVNVIEHDGGTKVSFDIWILVEVGVAESWIKLFTTAPLLQVENQERILVQVLVLWKNGKILLESCLGEVIMLDPTTEEVWHLQMNGEPVTLQIVRCIKSEIRLEGRNEV